MQAYRQKIIRLLKEKTIFKDIDEHIVSETLITPKDFSERFNAYNGATFGLKPTLKQSNYYRPHNKFSAAENLYFCGSSTHPGAGVPIVNQSSRKIQNRFTWLSHSCLNEKLKVSMPCMRFADVQMI